MSDIQANSNATEATVSPLVTTDDPSVIPENTTKDDAATSTETPVIESKDDEITPHGHLKEETTSSDVKEEPTPADKVIEPITEGQLTYKAPGLLK